jgi:hypothetical protein
MVGFKELHKYNICWWEITYSVPEQISKVFRSGSVITSSRNNVKINFPACLVLERMIQGTDAS